MGIYKRGDIYWYKFMWRGKLIRESTKQPNDKVARNQEAAHRLRLANGEVGIREKKPKLLLKEFLKNDFLPYAETAHAKKPRTLRYYKQGTDMLFASEIARLPLEDIDDQGAKRFAAERAALSPSGINRGLRTLRRALNLAYQWKRLDRPAKIELAKGERQRDRVLTPDEQKNYLNACPQPWRDCAKLILDEGFRPGEVFPLQWPQMFFNKNGTGLIQILEGKSKAARRILPMTSRVYELLRARHEECGGPTEGWVFPSAAKVGHFNENAAKDQHKKALENSRVSRFEPYVLRHTALTQLGEAAGGDVFALAKIAGHSSITITQRYVHPQAQAIDRVFAVIKKSQQRVGTKLGTAAKRRKIKLLKSRN
jgi:integrase